MREVSELVRLVIFLIYAIRATSSYFHFNLKNICFIPIYVMNFLSRFRQFRFFWKTLFEVMPTFSKLEVDGLPGAPTQLLPHLQGML
jgi:hypothetical protein